MSAVSRTSPIAAPNMLSRFRGALVASVLGDCIGVEFEDAPSFRPSPTASQPLDRVLQYLSALDDETRGGGILKYSDDTAMMRCIAESLLTRKAFDERDMASRFAKEYKLAPYRGYGLHIVRVLRQLASPHLKDVFQPAQSQFDGRGSFGNGGAMRTVPFALAFKSRNDVHKYSELGAKLTHSCSLGYNGAVLQALAVHLSLQGALAQPKEFINKLIAEMEEMEKDKTAQLDAKALNLSEFPYCSRLHKVKELMDKNSVSIEEVISELGNGIAALQSVPTAIFCVLHCLEPRDGLPEKFGGVERTIAYSCALGGDTDTIACMAGAIAGAHYGIDSIPQSWQKSCEGVAEADDLAHRLYDFYCLPRSEEDRGTKSTQE
ncbi:ADP-ribosylhydrolase ARH3-like [Pseudorasbora parva]|uniref:ADP-ribosylhydrolase ARH3-like n=1 Tax=Pseudorasbora parva TaxID=51549 RepID=UPI00351E3CC4